MLFSLLILTLLPLVALATPLDFENDRDFYHSLGSQTIRLLMHNMVLNEETVETLNRLLTNDRLRIQDLYNKDCHQIKKSRATEILGFFKGRKDLEMHLLGPMCLSNEIVEARKEADNMWPLIGFPILVGDGVTKSFSLANIDAVYTKDILNKALESPQWWYSSSWQGTVKWEEMMNDLHFWRMIEISNLDYGMLNLYSYLMKAIHEIPENPDQRDLEQLLSKSIRMTNFRGRWDEALEKKSFDGDAILDKFSNLDDPWSMAVLDVLRTIYSTKWESALPNALLRSGLLTLAFWPNQSNNGPIDTATAINDILELFLLAFRIEDVEIVAEKFKSPLLSFLDSLVDWSGVCPMVLSALAHRTRFLLANTLLERFNFMAALERSVDFGGGHHLLLRSKSLPTQLHRIRRWVGSLKDDCETRGANYPVITYPDPYTDLLCGQWAQDKETWPGIDVAHEINSFQVREVFRDSEIEENTWDPDIDTDYSVAEWRLAFFSIRFDVERDFTSSAVPSKCFLQLLFHLDKMISESRNGGWDEIANNAGEECSFPDDDLGQFRYLSALRVAREVFVRLPGLPLHDINLLQDLIRNRRVSL